MVAAYACFEFLDVNLFHTGIVTFVRISAGGDAYRPQFLEWIRARGFEPGLWIAPFSEQDIGRPEFEKATVRLQKALKKKGLAFRIKTGN